MSIAKEISIRQLADMVKGRIVGDVDTAVKITGTCAIDSYVQAKVSFINNEKYGAMLAGLHNAIVLIPGGLAHLCGEYPQNTYVVVEDVLTSMMDLQDAFYSNLFVMRQEGVSPTATIGTGTTIGHNVYVGDHVYVGKDVSIGDGAKIMHNCSIFDGVIIGSNTYVCPNVCIYGNCRVGDDCLIHPGACIGVDGFRFEQDVGRERVRKWIHMGGVDIGRRVEIGPNATIQRSTYEHSSTIVSDDVKIDAHVHVGHNDRIGARTVIAAQTCICGSVAIREDCWIGAGVTIAQGTVIGSRAKVLINAVVVNDVPDGEMVSGFYAMPHKRWKQVCNRLRDEL